MRYDQFMKFGWKVLIPVSLFWIMVVATMRVLSLRGASRLTVLLVASVIVLIVLLTNIALDSSRKKRMLVSEYSGDATVSFAVPALPTKTLDGGPRG